MLKLGVVRRQGAQRPRTALGRKRHISLLLLRELARSAQVSPQEYDHLIEHARMGNGVWKLTRHGRLRLLDEAVMDILAQRYAADTPLVVCDLAASTGATSVEFFDALRERFPTRFIASDFYRDLIAVCSRRWPVAVVFDRDGQEIQYLCGRFVMPGAPPESLAYPINRGLKALLRQRFVPAARAAFRHVAAARLAPFATADVDGFDVVKLPILAGNALAALAAGDGFTFEEWNILEPLPERAHVVRAMNILTRDHFPDAQRARAITNCVRAVLPGGLFIVGASPTADATGVEASIYTVHDGRLARAASLNGGSEIDALVASTCTVVEDRVAAGMARSA